MNSETLAYDADAAGLLTYDTEGGTGNTFVELVPDAPDFAVSIITFGGQYDLPASEAITEYQVRVRGAAGDALPAQQVAAALANRWRTVGYQAPQTWAAGTDAEARVIYAQPSIPYLLGWDENGRPEWVFRIKVRHVV